MELPGHGTVVVGRPVTVCVTAALARLQPDDVSFEVIDEFGDAEFCDAVEKHTHELTYSTSAVALTWTPTKVGDFVVKVYVLGQVIGPAGSHLLIGPCQASAPHCTIVRARQRRRGRGVMASLVSISDGSNVEDLVRTLSESGGGTAMALEETVQTTTVGQVFEVRVQVRPTSCMDMSAQMFGRPCVAHRWTALVETVLTHAGKS